MNKKFCDICGEEVKVRDERDAFENSIFIRIERDSDKLDISDACDDCITEFRQTFSKFIKEKEVSKK